jgi:hypothetical protein
MNIITIGTADFAHNFFGAGLKVYSHYICINCKIWSVQSKYIFKDSPCRFPSDKCMITLNSQDSFVYGAA